MARVYLAEDLKHERPVAIKVLRPELGASLGANRFLREIKVTARLSHAHILPLLDSGEAGGRLFYVMPYVEGVSLRDRLDREAQLPVADATHIASEVAAALHYAHERGIVHRDIKPENIMLDEGRVWVADFGIARGVTEATRDRLTETGMTVGTPAYMSPEQATAERNIDGRSDIYALGCVLYEMLSGQPPFSGPSGHAILAGHAIDPVPDLLTLRSSIPPDLVRVVERALAKAPADRFPTAAAFRDALLAPEVYVRSATLRSRRPLLIVALIVGALVAVGLFALT